jgi:hypothetical protein
VKKFGKVLSIGVLGLLVLAAAVISLTIGWRPVLGPRARTATARKFERTPARLERGRYLANSVVGCMFCHSPHDWTQHMLPVVSGMLGAGAPVPYGDVPGKFVAPNLTPDPETGSGNWTDDQIARAIREGIGHDGRALFPTMPYKDFRNFSDEDVASIVVYLRSLPPVRRELPKSNVTLLAKYLVRRRPEPLEHTVSASSPSDRVAYGKYLISLSGCEGCHTAQHGHGEITQMSFAGGAPVKVLPWFVAASANLTPDSSGIGYYDEELFLKVLRTGYVRARPLSPVMPYAFYGNMSDDDLKAIFAFLRTVTPVKHRVDNSLPPTYCRFCRQTHGAGDQN